MDLFFAEASTATTTVAATTTATTTIDARRPAARGRDVKRKQFHPP